MGKGDAWVGFKVWGQNFDSARSAAKAEKRLAGSGQTAISICEAETGPRDNCNITCKAYVP